jgi:hypothetical protein
MAERTVRKLSGTEYPVTEETYAQVAWLLKKYSSYTYCERLRRIYGSFLVGYKAHAKTEPWVEWYMETLARLFHYQGFWRRVLRSFGWVTGPDIARYRWV